MKRLAMTSTPTPPERTLDMPCPLPPPPLGPPQMASQQLQRALARLSAENDALTALVTQGHGGSGGGGGERALA